MKRETLFSVLIANYNNGKYIKYAIESALEQTYPNVEIIIVDDSSNDSSLEIIRSFQQAHLNIKLFQNSSNRGCGFTKRRLTELAGGSILGFLDPDDTLMPQAVELMVSAHLANEKVSLIGSSHYVCDEQLRIEREAYGACEIPSTESYLSYGKGITAFSSFKNSYYRQTPGIDASYKRAVDQDLYYKLEEVGDILYLPQVLYKYRVHHGGISSYNNIAKARYWMVLAKAAAYRRRLDMEHIKNISPAELRSWWSILYATKAGVALGAKKYGSAFCWMCKSIIKSPVDSFWRLRIQSLMILSKPGWIKQLI